AVKITADIIELQTKFAVARAEVSGLSTEFNKLARSAAAGTLDAGGQARMQQLAGDLLAAKTNVAGLGGQLEKAGFSFNRMGLAGSETGVHVATLTRHSRNMATELAEGKFASAGNGLIRIASHLGGMGPLAMGAVAGVGALAAGLGSLVVQAVKASNELDHMQVVAALLGKTSDRGAVEAYVKEGAQMGDVPEKEPRRIVSAWLSLPEASETAMAAMIPLTRAG